MHRRDKWLLGIFAVPVLLGVIYAVNKRAQKERQDAEQTATVSQPRPQPYYMCERQVFDQSAMPGHYRLRYIITPVERDMAKIATRELAATAYAALKYLEGDPRAISTTVLMLEHCKGTTPLARAQVGASPGEAVRLVTASKRQSHGPGAELVRLAEVLHEIRGAQERETTEADYAEAGTRLGMSAGQARDRHLKLTGWAELADRYPAVEGVPAMGPEIR